MAAGASLLITVAFCVFYAVLEFESLWLLIATNSLWVAGYVAVIRVNATGRTRQAGWLVLFVGLANTVVPAAILGRASGVYLFLVLVPMVGVLLSGPRTRLMRAAVITFGALAFVSVPVIFDESHPVLEGTSAEAVLFVVSALVVALFGSFFALYYKWLVDDAEAALAEANERSELLLANILPASIIDRLKTEETRIADRIEQATVLFADIVDSTPLAERLSAVGLVELLDGVFSRFDELTEQHGLEKIATIGDCYLAASGLQGEGVNGIRAAADLALAMRESLELLAGNGLEPLQMKFGLATGPVVAGVIGKHKIRYDLWGDTVNVASRMETHGLPGMIHVTDAVRDALADGYEFQARGPIYVRGKGEMETYFLMGRSTPISTVDAREFSDPVPM